MNTFSLYKIILEKNIKERTERENKYLHQFIKVYTNKEIDISSLTKFIIDFNELIKQYKELTENMPYNYKDYKNAKSKGLDLDDWNDYVKYYKLGENEEYQ